MRTTGKPDPDMFPEPHRVATWIAHRRPQFKTHSVLGLAKNAISAKAPNQGAGRIMPCEAYVYVFSGTKWEQVEHIPKGTNIRNHSLWKTRSKKLGPIPPSEDEEAEAIRLIMEP